ncbi:MAG: pentapeptide repeat-containing protein, partial [Actinomycetota bacterium]|nr:pentapeptide repeat-containing protein [Actinomycetota bacterium]
MSTAPETRSDCSRCFGLCCVALPFARSADFAADKPAGVPCRHLGLDHGCGIHSSLPEEGYRGCTVFECFGAGQQVSQVTFQGMSWREAPTTAASMFAVFPVVQALHEVLRHLQEAATWELSPALAGQLETLTDEVVARTADGPDRLLALDVGELRSRVGPVLGAASAAVRRAGPEGSPY